VPELLRQAREIDREFLERLHRVPLLRLELRYAEIEPIRRRRMERLREAAARLLEPPWRGMRRAVRAAYGEAEFAAFLREHLRLYAREVDALGGAVRPAVLVSLFRARLLAAMEEQAERLAQDAARLLYAEADTVKFRDMARVRLVAGNWKMHGSRASVAALLDALAKESPAGCAVCAPFPYLAQVAERLKGTAIAWGAQNVSEHEQGAHTGEVSAAMLAEFGCRYVIVGHSERRQLYGETDAQAAAKFAAVRKAGMTPILCVGETLAERDAGATEEVVGRQLGKVLERNAFDGSVLAYEPVWAIGTGRNATPEQAQAVHAFLRKRVPQGTSILYGGSVKPQNAAAIFAMPDVDGGLIGGASLVARDFLDIVKANT
jgi:triosephosphate isomerase